jgi:ADP-ribosylglycohydrolase
MIGAIIGDIVGSRFEFHNIKSKEFDFFSDRCGFTDDSVMTCAVAEALTRSWCKDRFSTLDEVTKETLRDVGYWYPRCGYGRKFIEWMYGENPQPYNSCGNGSAMRISPVGDIARSIEEAKALSYAVTAVTHNHPEGIKGAEATAVAIFLARKSWDKDEIRSYIEENYYDLSTTVDDYRNSIDGHGKEICQLSVPQALRCFYEGESYEDVIRNCISIGGDSDTIAAIAGGIAGAYFEIPETIESKGLSYLDPVLKGISARFNALQNHIFMGNTWYISGK